MFSRFSDQKIMESSSFVGKFNIRDKWLYAKIDWKENDTDLFFIKIYEEQNCWVGRFSKEFADSYRDRVDETEEEYKKNVKAGLVLQLEMFTYDFLLSSDDNSSATFSWIKTFKDSDVDVTMVHGSVPIHRVNASDSKNDLIDVLLEQNKDLKHVIESYEMHIHMLKSELEQAKADLEKFMDAKISLESSVYGKFITLLNGKKRRIQLLENNLQALGPLGQTLPGDNDVD